MSRRTLAAIAGLVALGACARGDDSTYDTTAGMTSGAMATPPAIGLSTSVLDSATLDSIRKDSIRLDSIRRRDTSKTP